MDEAAGEEDLAELGRARRSESALVILARDDKGR